jgi:hypothetical protein
VRESRTVQADRPLLRSEQWQLAFDQLGGVKQPGVIEDQHRATAHRNVVPYDQRRRCLQCVKRPQRVGVAPNQGQVILVRPAGSTFALTPAIPHRRCTWKVARTPR